MGTREIASKAIGNFNIDKDQVYIVDKNNFGWTSDDDTISTATVLETGGILIYSNDEARGGVLNEVAQTYAVQIESLARPKAFVHVPWINSQYLVNQPNWYVDAGGTIQDLVLCVDENDITRVGDTMMSSLGWLHIDKIDIAKIVSRNHTANDNTLLSTTEELSNYISDPLRNEITILRNIFNKEMQDHITSNATDFYNVRCEISSLCIDINEKVNDLSDNLSNDIDKLSSRIYDQYKVLSSEQDISPWWFKKNTLSAQAISNMFKALSDEVVASYMYKYEAYLCAETSSKYELEDMFNTKQNNLSIRTTAVPELSGEKDIPTVKAMIDFVNSSIQTETATFRGSYDSLKDVPTDGTRYVGGKPDQNDYMFVDITDDTTGAWRESLKTLLKGTWRFKYVCNKRGDHSLHSCWDETGIGGWYEEYLINDAMFTAAQTKALNSGIDANLVSLIMSYASIKAKLTAECPNMVAKLGNLAYLDAITNNITGRGNAGKLAVFDGTNSIKSNDSISPRVETWKFTLVDGSSVTKKIVVSD